MDLKIKIAEIKQELQKLTSSHSRKEKMFHLSESGGTITHLKPTIVGASGEIGTKVKIHVEYDDAYYSFLITMHHKKNIDKSMKKALKKIRKKGMAYLQKHSEKLDIDYLDIHHPDDVLDVYKEGIS
jgi:hypothetical protein